MLFVAVKNVFRVILSIFNLEAKYHLIKFKHTNTPKSFYNGIPILSKQEGNNLIKSKILQGDPFIVGRIGATEMALLYNYLCYSSKGKVKWNNGIKERIWNLSGVFPTDDFSLQKFAELYLESIKEVDVLGVWYNEGEELVVKKYCNNTSLVQLESLEPYYFSNPWSECLKNKKVLVIHPFEKTILEQYNFNRDELFSEHNVLPEFELSTIKAVQSIAKNDVAFSSWFDALDDMKEKIECIEFDIAIIGAGAYGLPLAHHVKKLGKQAIHMGGATQILFGIKGKRWDDHPEISALYNDFWTRPTLDEVVPQANIVEGGCYW